MKKWIPAAIGAAVLVALGAGAWYSGLRAEQAFRDELPNINTGPALQLELARYDRGLFRSEGVLAVRFVTLAEAESPVLFEQPFTVVHGPLLWDSSFGFRPAAFGLKAQLQAQPDWPADLKAVLADDRVELLSRTGFDGSNHTRLHIADGELQLAAGTLALQAGELSVDYDPASKAMQADFTWPGFHLRGEQGELQLDELGFHWAGTYYSRNVQIGQGDYHLNALTAKQGEQEMFALRTLTASGQQSLDSSGEKLSSNVDLALAGVRFMGQDMVKDGTLHLELNNLSMAALKQLDELNSAELGPDQMPQVLTSLTALFEHGAELKIAPLSAQIQGQPFLLTLLAKLPAAATTGADPEPANPLQLFQQAELDLDVAAAPALLAMWAPAELAGLADAEGKLVVRLRQGEFRVNGQPYVPGAQASEADGDWADQAVLDAEQAGEEAASDDYPPEEI